MTNKKQDPVDVFDAWYKSVRRGDVDPFCEHGQLRTRACAECASVEDCEVRTHDYAAVQLALALLHYVHVTCVQDTRTTQRLQIARFRVTVLAATGHTHLYDACDCRACAANDT